MLFGVLGIIYAAYKMFMKESSGSKTNPSPPVIQTIQPSALAGVRDTKY
jgi:hypothetical protein